MHEAPPEHEKPRPLSEHDPAHDAPTSGRRPVLLISVIVLLVTAFVVLHLTGVVSPGNH